MATQDQLGQEVIGVALTIRAKTIPNELEHIRPNQLDYPAIVISQFIATATAYGYKANAQLNSP